MMYFLGWLAVMILILAEVNLINLGNDARITLGLCYLMLAICCYTAGIQSLTILFGVYAIVRIFRRLKKES